jgi:hypothetical protein
MAAPPEKKRKRSESKGEDAPTLREVALICFIDEKVLKDWAVELARNGALAGAVHGTKVKVIDFAESNLEPDDDVEEIMPPPRPKRPISFDAQVPADIDAIVRQEGLQAGEEADDEYEEPPEQSQRMDLY